MSTRARQVRIGAFVLGGLVLFVGAIALIGSGRLFRKTYPFVSYFDGSVNGLRPGAAVKFKGVEIGRVDHIQIPFRVDRTDQPIAVYFSLDGDTLESTQDRSKTYADALQGAVQNGLRARLEADSMLTGILHVSLSFTAETEMKLHDALEGVMEIPTTPRPLQDIASAVRAIVDKIGQSDFPKLFASMQSALDSIGELARAPEVKSILSSLDRTLQSLDAAVTKLEKQVGPLAERLEAAARSVEAAGNEIPAGMVSVKATMGSIQEFTKGLDTGLAPLLASLKQSSEGMRTLTLELERTLQSTRVLLDPAAPIAVELQATLRELSETARSTRALFDFLERNPSSLLRGKSTEGDDSR